MPVRRKTPKHEFDGRGCRAVIVGVHTETNTVERIWIHEDGGMMFGSFVSRPWAGRTAIGEAITLFGLTQIRQFPAADREAATAYARLLETELRPPPP